MDSLKTLAFYAEYCRVLMDGTRAALALVECAREELGGEAREDSGKTPEGGPRLDVAEKLLLEAAERLKKAATPPKMDFNIQPPPPWQV